MYSEALSSPFTYSIMEPILRWFHVGWATRVHTCVPKDNTLKTYLANIISSTSAAFANYLLCPIGDLHNLKVKVNKVYKKKAFSQYARLLEEKKNYAGVIYNASSMDQGNRDGAVGQRSTHATRRIQTRNPKESGLTTGH